MGARDLVIGTRGSALALRQSEWVRDALRRLAPDRRIALKVIKTHGDRVREVSLAALGGEGVFVKEIKAALLAREVDFAVHSLKDLPTESPAGLVIAAVPPREDARDVLVSAGQGLMDLPRGARLGTSSLRRRAQALHLRGDFEVLDLRGNVETRVRRLDEGRYDAIILAAAGLRRLGLADRITEYLSFERMLPAAGQGALGVECRSDDAETSELLSGLEDRATRAAVTAERAFLHRLGAGCHAPAAANARVEGGVVEIQGLIAAPGGNPMIRGRLTGDQAHAEAIGIRLAESLLAQGGDAILRVLEAKGTT